MHNMHLERGFGFWDRKKRTVPALSSLASEGCLLFTCNKTLDWLMKPVDEREELVRCCQRQTPQMKATFKERAKKLQQELEARLQQQQREKAEKEARELRDRMALIGRVEDAGGLWRSADQMEEALGQLKNTSWGEAKRKCLDAIKAQMTYRKRKLRSARKTFKFFREWTRIECRATNGEVADSH